MLSVTALGRELGGRTVLRDVTFNLERGELLGVVGPNGAGKTTLLRILAGLDEPDRGTVKLVAGAAFGYLSQGFAGREGESVTMAFPRAFAMEDAARELERLAIAIGATSDPAETDRLSADYDALLSRISARAEFDLGAARAALGIEHIGPEAKLGQLSGGEITRLGLLDLVAASPDLMLLDEPTNNLDVAGLAWLEGAIRGFRGAIVAVSHDRAFLDACAKQVLELQPGGQRAEVFAGNYSALIAEKERRRADQEAAYERQERETAQLKEAIHKIETRAKGIENRTIDFAKRKKALKIARRAVTLKARLERELESTEHVSRPDAKPMAFHGRLELANPAGGSSRLIAVTGLALEAGGRRLFEGLELSVNRGECVVVNGPNGRGKTTLLRTILGEHPASEGAVSLSPSAKVGYLAQQDDPSTVAQGRGLTPVDLLRQTAPMTEAEATNFLHRFLLGHDQVRTRISLLSYGERRRLSLALIVRGGANLLILDEPTNHLDLESRESFEAALDGYVGAILAVSHDRRFVERFADVVVEL
ncbi:ribosomal protection-like ABC-F family protein [Candidatus Amarobacter glycogenicus]|uniref:ribosomal protection-like ABC-F family protein n=1 Tax=Candidatus Amarobacter glycogenicus TaxID=3140699 RepID=UPI002A0F60C7|nr:ABC-F family ATP-binding cassette domain-containing protein [Dehalococcoidia bacterium]